MLRFNRIHDFRSPVVRTGPKCELSMEAAAKMRDWPCRFHVPVEAKLDGNGRYDHATVTSAESRHRRGPRPRPKTSKAAPT